MSDRIVEHRVTDREGNPWSTDDYGPREDAEAFARDLARDCPAHGPFRVQSRVVTDWTDLATEAAAESPAAA